MKLRKFNVFLMLLGLLVLLHLLQPYVEGYSNKKKSCSKKKTKHHTKKNKKNGERDFFNDSNYMLKTEMVPPVCPKCPDVTIDESFQRKKCPPCPPCARCPEPAFKCKKVPDYSFSTMNNLPEPMPMLNDFSQF